MNHKIIFFVFIFSGLALSQPLQKDKLVFYFHNQSLRQALHEISDKTNVRFIFDDALVDGKSLNTKVSSDSLAGVLKTILSENNLGYKRIASGKIVLYRAEQNMIRGYVLDGENGEALPYANILLKGTRRGTSSNTDGFFALANKTAAPCTLSVTYIGYRPGEVIADVPGETHPLKVEMQQQSIKTPDVTISAERPPIIRLNTKEGAIQLEPKAVRTLPSIGQSDINRTLQFIPGVSAVDNGFYVRGGTTGQNLVLFDDIPVYHTTHFYGFFSAFNPDAVGTVKLFRGNAPLRYGNHSFGVLDVSSIKPNFNKFKLAASISTLAAQMWVNLPLSQKVAWTFSIRRSFLDINKNSLIKKLFLYQTGAPDQPSYWGYTRYHFSDMSGRIAVALTARDSINTSMFYGSDNSEKSYWNYNSKDNTGQTGWNNLGVNFAWLHHFAGKSRMKIGSYFSDYKSSFYRNYIPGFYLNTSYYLGQHYYSIRLENQVKDGGIYYFQEKNIFGNHRLSWGLAFSSKRISRKTDQKDIVRNRSSFIQGTSFLQSDWRFFNFLNITAGLRLDRISNRMNSSPKSYPNPRLTAAIDMTSHLQLRTGIGRYHQFVSGFENNLYIREDFNTNLLIGNDMIWRSVHKQPIDNLQTSIGMKYENDRFLFDFDVYQYKTNNWINIVYQDFLFHTKENDEWQNRLPANNGVDVLLQKKSGAIRGWISYSYSKLGQVFQRKDGWVKAPANYDLRHQANCVLQYAAGKWRFSIAWTFTSGRPYTGPENLFYLQTPDGSVSDLLSLGKINSCRLPSFHHLDVNLSRSFSTRFIDWQVGGTIYNIYDRKNVWYRQFYYDAGFPVVRVMDAYVPSFNPNIYVRLYLR